MKPGLVQTLDEVLPILSRKHEVCLTDPIVSHLEILHLMVPACVQLS